MSKKTNSKARFMVTLVFAIILCFSLAMPAFASGDADPKFSEAEDEDNQAQAAITKILKMPIGTETPAKSFFFEFEKMGLPNEKDEPDYEPAVQPGIKPIEIEFAATDTGNEVNNIKEVRLQSIDFIADSNLTKAWERAGVYEYLLTEVDQSDDPTYKNTFKDYYDYSDTEYTVLVYVANKEETTGLYVQFVEVKIAVRDEENDDEVGTKVNPTPGGNPGNGAHSKVVFTNYYLKKNGGTTPSEANTVLGISKKVKGLTADQTKYFEFNVKVTRPATIDKEGIKYTAYIMEGSTVVTPLPTTTTDGTIVKGTAPASDYIEFPSGADVKVYLKHGQKLAFMDVPVGAEFAVTESAETLYTAGVTVISNKNPYVAGPPTEILGKGFTNPTANTALAIPLPNSADADPTLKATQTVGDMLTTDKRDGAAFLNDTGETSPMGLNTNTLPFIMLIVVVAAAIAGFVVIRYRRNVRYDA